MRNAQQTEQLLIGKSISRTSTVNVLDVNNASYLADGEVVVLDDNDTPLVAGTTFPTARFIKIVQRSGATAATSQLVQSARIDGSNIISFRGLSYSAPQEQITYVGYDSTTGALDASQTGDYVLRITMKHDKDMWSQQANTRIFRFSPLSTSTNADINDYFAVAMATDVFLNTEVTTERTSNDAGSATTAASGTLTFTKGSKIVTTSGVTPATDFPVGSYMRLGLSKNSGIYKVVAVSNAGQSITLDAPVQIASGTLTVTNAQFITNALVLASNVGLKVTGIAQSFLVMKFPYVKVKFDLTLSGFGSTTVNYFQNSLPGSGVDSQISQIEKFAQGFEGIIDRFGDSAPIGRTDTVTGAVYDVIVIEYFNNFDTLAVSGAKPARAVLNIAMVDGAAQTVNLLAQLNPWMKSLPQNFNNVAV